MIILEYEEIEVDYCVACHGVWLDAGELELLFGDRGIADGFMTAGDPAQAAPGEAVRPCPGCDAPMEKATTDGAAPVTYDFCKDGHGMWFDKGELNAVLKHGSAMPGGDKVAHWLQEMFPTENET
jgi:Zn-finger nucleic acid-binding protein